MTSRRSFALGAAFSSVVCCWILAEARPPLHIAPNYADGLSIPANAPPNLGRTFRNGGVGCGPAGGCHDSSGSINVAIAGPVGGTSGQLAAGTPGTFNITTTNNGCDVCTVGIDVAAGDGTLAPFDGSTQMYGNEITHTSPPKTPPAMSHSATYPFSFTIANGALPGSAHKLYGTGKSFYWNFADTFNVIVPLGSNPPTNFHASGSTPGSLTFTWDNSFAAYELNCDMGLTAPTSPTAGTVQLFVPGQNTKEVKNLSPSTHYACSLWGASQLPVGTSKTTLYTGNGLPAGAATAFGTTADPPPPNVYSFLRTGNLGTARYGHTATLLANGKVLVAGGQGASSALNSAELYDPATGTFAYTGSMSAARVNHTATALPNGKVLITGGSISSVVSELYDPVTGTFSDSGSMLTTRSGHTATMLYTGKVLIAGGTSSDGRDEIYDPSNGSFTPTLSTTMRFFHTATLLSDGRVLIVGGSATSGGVPLNTGEVYDPIGNTFTATGTLTAARKNHTATNTGVVQLVGGIDSSGNSLGSTETYDSSMNAFTYSANGAPYATAKHAAFVIPSVDAIVITGGRASNGSSLNTTGGISTNIILSDARASHTATILPDERVLIVGGNNGSEAAPTPSDSAELFDSNVPVNTFPRAVQGDFFATVGAMTDGRYSHTATQLPNGKVLVAGGSVGSSSGCSYELSSAELYDGFFTPTGSMGQARTEHTATLLPNGKVLIAGGFTNCGSTHLKSAELYDPGNGTFSPTGDMTAGRSRHTATLLPNGKVLITGGIGTNFASLKSAELYDPDTGTFSATGDMVTARDSHSATLLLDGRVLVAGGYDENTLITIGAAELYNPIAGTFAASNAGMFYSNARQNHVAVLLQNGKVLFAGGMYQNNGNYNSINSGLLYDPATDDYTLAGCCVYQTNVMGQNGGRFNAAAVLLPDGTVLTIGGENEGGRLTTGEIYDPVHDSSLPVSGSMSVGRAHLTATLLTNGTVLAAGGYGPNVLTNIWNTAEWFGLSTRFPFTEPSIITAPSTLYLPAAINVTGIGMRGISEEASGNTQSSPSDLPLLRLQRIDDGQIFFIQPSARSATAFNSTIVNGLPDGHYRLTIISNGLPSAQSIVAIRTVPLIGPTSMFATATSTTTVSVTWVAVGGAVNYEILRSTDHVNYSSRGTATGTTFSDSASAGTAYLYKVHAINALGAVGPDSTDLVTTVFFTDDPIVAGTTIVKAVHITELQTGIDAVRTLAGLGGGSYTAISGGSIITAGHFVELRNALDPARSALGLPAISYTDSSLTAGIVIKSAHVTQLRNGVK